MKSKSVNNRPFQIQSALFSALPTKTLLRLSSVVVLGLGCTASLQANTLNWAGGTNTLWATGTNWGGIAPVNDLTTDIANFNSATYTNQPNAGTTSITGITVGASSTGSLTISGTALSLGASGITVASGSGAVTISATSTRIGANQSWANNSANLLTVGAITNVGNVTPFTLTLSGTGAGGTTLSGAITNGGVTGTTALIVNKSGGTVTLSGANTFTGGVTLTAGTLNINSTTALGNAAGTFVIGSGSTINNSTGASITLTQNNTQTWNGSYTFTGTQSLTFGTGAITMAANTTVTASASTLTEGGAIGGGSFTLTKAGAGTLVLNGANTYNGLTTVSAGVLTLAGNNTGSGGVTLTAGTLNINNAGALGTGTLTITTGTINNSSGTDITTSTNNNAQAWNGSFTYSGSRALNLGTGNVTLGASPTVTVGGTGLNSAGALTVGGAISGAGRSLTKAGNGTLILSGTNTYDGGTTINAGVLQFNTTGAIAGSGNNVTLGYGATAAFGYALDQSTLTGRLVSGSRGTVALGADSGNNLDFAASGLTNLSLGASTGTWVYSGALWTPANSIYRLGGGGGTLTFNPALTGSNSLVVGGGGSGGTVTLANAGTYNGGTTVSGGTGGTTIGATGGGSLLQTNVLAGASTTPFGTNAAITLNNGALGLGTAGTLSGGEVVTASGYDVTYSGQNAINLKAGSGSVNFNANSLIRSNNGVLLLNPTSGTTLGTTEKVTVASGAPTVTNGMVSPFYIDGTTKNFLTYDPVNGFKDATFTKSGNKTTIATAGATDIVLVTDSTFDGTFGGNKAIYALKYINTSGFNANGLGSGVETLTLLSGGLIFDLPNAGGGVNISSDGSQHGNLNFGTSEAMVGIFTGGVVQGNQNNTNWIGSGGFTLYGTGSLSANSMLVTGGINIAGGTFRLGGSGVINSNNYLTIGKAGVFQFTSASTNQVLGLSGDGLVNNTSSGATFVIDGLLNTGTTSFGGIIQDAAGTITLTKNGLNTQVLTGSNTYSSSTTVNGGVLRLDFSGANAPSANIINNTANSSALALGGGKLDIVGAAGSTNSQRFNNLTINAGNSSISVSSGTGGTTNVTLGGGTPTLTRNVGGTINFDLPASGSISTTATTFSGNGVLVGVSATGPAFATVNGTDWAKVTAGTIGALASYDTNDFSASTKNTDVTSNQGPTAFTVNTLRFNTAGATLSLTGSNVIGTGGILVTSATSGLGNGVTITGGTNIKSSAGNEMVIINNGQLTMGSAIADGSGASALTLSGSGTTTLNVANTFTGNAYLNSGTVVVGHAAAFGTTAGTLNLNGGTLQSASAITLNAKAIALNRNTIISGSNDLTLSGTFTNNSSSNTLTVNNTGATALSGGVVLSSTLNVAGSGNLTTSGVISSTGGLTYAGSGTMTLSNAASTYTGATKVSNGTLSVGTLANGAANSSIGASTNAATTLILDGGTLKYTGATVSTDRLFSVGGSGGTLDASGSGVLTLSNAGSIGFANTPGTRTLTLGGTNTGANTLNPILSDFINVYANSLNKTGAGQWVLAGANTYTGGTTISNGTLALSGSGTYGTGALTVSGGTADLGTKSITNTLGALTGGGAVNNGTITNNSGNYDLQSGSVGAILAGSNGLNKTTGGTVTLSGVNTYNGPTTVSGGTLLVNGSINNSTVTVASGGTLGGSGSFGASVNIQGTHNPGNSPGIQTFNSGLSYSGGASVVNWELKSNTTTNAANPNAIFDSLIVNGNLDFAGATTLNLSFVPTGSDVLWSDALWDTSKTGTAGWLLYDVSGTTTGFANLGLTSINWLDSGGNAFNTELPGASFSLYQDGNDIYLNYSAVPEPSTYAMIGVGLLSLWALRRKKSTV